jgi:tetratricopeptide (TPR) repeat protein
MKRAGLVVVVLGAMVGNVSAEDSVDSFDLLAQAAARSHAGDHLGAIELYEQVYRQDTSMDLLVLIGSEYRKAGKTDEALQNFCAYLAVEPNGDLVALAQDQALSVQASLGRGVGGPPGAIGAGNACAPAQPMLPPIEVPLERQITPHTPNGMASQREIAGIVTGAAGLVGIATGVYYGARAKRISDQILDHDPSTPWPTDIKDIEERGQHAETMQKLFLLGGALATATGAYLYVTGHSLRIANEHLSVSPTPLRQGGGVVLLEILAIERDVFDEQA